MGSIKKKKNIKDNSMKPISRVFIMIMYLVSKAVIGSIKSHDLCNVSKC